MPARPVDIIARKRNDEPLSASDLADFVQGYGSGTIPDYQMAALLMAIYIRGMSMEETSNLTRAMIATGDTVRFDNITGFTADKHSTGGVGDKTTLVLAPLLASLGVVVPKLSGRGLGHTGGTIDKLEAIPGFRTQLSVPEFIRIANRVGVVVAAATQDLVPADQKIYALRDVTATVDSIPLIASSIMSKKLAVKTDALVLDVKVGRGAFFPHIEEARSFASTAGHIGKQFGRVVSFVLTGMDEPLGFAVGNAIEVREAIDALRGEGPRDLVDVCVALAAQIVAARDGVSPYETSVGIRSHLQSGEAVATLERWIVAQGGNPRVVHDPDILPQASHASEVRASRSGYVAGIDARVVGELAEALGAGRARKEDTIDPAAGILLQAKVGTRVAQGDVLATLVYNREPETTWVERAEAAFTWSDTALDQPQTVLEVIGPSAV